MACPRVELGTLTFVFKFWDAVAARVGDAREFNYDDRARVLVVGKRVGERRKVGLVRLDHAAVAVKPKNVGRTLKGAEHKNDSAVFFQVSDGLDSAAVEVDIGDFRWRENAKCVESLGRKVDVACGIERG